MSRTTIQRLVVVALLGALAVATSARAADAPAAPAKSAAKKKPAVKKGGTKDLKKAAKKLSEPGPVLDGPEVRGFREFCDTWMQKLRERDTYNLANIKWDTHEGRVTGEHLSYATECTCVAHEEPGKDPIGKITYRETKYRREGATQTEALAKPGTIVEQSDVTEIFRYAKGRWVY